MYGQNSMTPRSARSFAATALCLVLAGGAPGISAQELSARREVVALPDGIAPPVKEQLQNEAMVVTRGTARIEFWWVRGLASKLPSASVPAWSEVPDGALLGVMRTMEPLPDIRGVPIAPGVYTLRFALQPQNGDHLGASPYREFIVVGPAAADADPNPVGYEAAVKLGTKTQGRSHPATLSIDPPSSTEAAGSVITTEDGHSAIAIAVPFTSGGTQAGSLTFGLILVGRIDH
jgi:hypothetical protein